ncbi:MAG: NHLP family bacteriocin export ABC transporter peptidase/permease/ATPase subunit [Planctomycetes bacterium]|nr:NHLP family bacteriocin export ABC transporter peptidase/permease/ATPase subunit [Planctomycetota bacterium]
MESVECGAAALGICLAHHGRYVPLEQLRVDCGVSRDGSNAASVRQAGELYGMVSRGYPIELDDFKNVPLPCVIYWNFNHFLVVEGFGKGVVYLNDPAHGRRVVTNDEFDKSFSGIVLTFEPGPEFTRGGTKPSVIRALAKRLDGIRTALAFCVLAGLGLVVPGLVIPTFTKVFVDDILIAGSERWLVPLLLGMGLMALLRAGLTGLQAHYLMRSAMKLAITATGRFLWHVLRLPIEFFMQRYAGDVSSRIASNYRVAHALTGDLATSVIGLITAVFFVALMLRYDVVLTAIGVSVSLANLVVLRIVARRRGDDSQRMLQESGKLWATAMGGVQNIESIKAAARESDFFSRWSGYQAKASVAKQDLAASGAFLETLPQGLSLLSTALVIGVGGFRVMDGTLSVGMLVAFQTLLIGFTQPINDIVHLGGVIQRLTGDMRRLDDVLNYEIDPAFAAPSADDGTPGSAEGDADAGGNGTSRSNGRAPAVVRRLSGFLELRDVTFGYNRLQEPLLKNFNLRLAPGGRVALVGGSGSGKSTVAKLIAGLYRPWSGEVLFDNVDREGVPRALIANSFGMVDQDIFFYEGTIRDNLALWDSTLPDMAIQRAAKDACIHDVVTARRGGYAGIVEEGGRNFSGGQRQRLEIARALAIDPTVIVMDEATSALDAATEKIVDDNIRRRGCTCVIVAHRLSTIRDCNEIIVMERGEIVQRGTHEQLITVDGPYANLISAE